MMVVRKAPSWRAISCLWVMVASSTHGFCPGRVSTPRSLQRPLFASLEVRMDKTSQKPGRDFFPPEGTSYVPLGLTEERYAELKEQEKAEQAKMNYGRFGPRFLPDKGPPPGHWFLMSRLWSQGDPTLSGEPDESTKEKKSVIPRTAEATSRGLGRLMQDPSFAAWCLVYFGAHVFMAGVRVYRSKPTTIRTALQGVFGGVASVLRHKASLSLWARRVFLSHGMPILLASALFRQARDSIEMFHRQRLWTKRRIVATTALSSTGLLTLWTFVITRVTAASMVL